METQKKLDQVLQEFKNECKKRQLNLCPKFANFYIHLLIRDAQKGINLLEQSFCKAQKFLQNALSMYANPIDPTLCNMKIIFFFEHHRELDYDVFKGEYKEQHYKKMQPLIDGILLYPENSNEIQIDDMSTKIQAFIIANYKLGNPNNHVLLKQTRQSLNSVISRGDLRTFVLKMKQLRLDYLERLTATVCGILVYNNHGSDGDKENMRDIMVDLEMALNNTFESLESTLKHSIECKIYGFKAMSEIIEMDTNEKKVHCHYPVEKMHKINAFVALFCVYERFLRKLIDLTKKTKYRIESSKNKMKCIIHKIDDVLKYRTAIDAELIFPHFVQLSEIWSELAMYLNHLTVINRSKAQLDEIMTSQLYAAFSELVETTQIASVQMEYVIEPTFAQLAERFRKRIGKGSLAKVADYLKCFCALTIALTGGLLVPSTVQKKLCEDLNLKFGFANVELSKYAERYFEEFVCMLQSIIYTSVDLLLLFELHNEILRQDFDDITIDPVPKKKSFQTQTEMVEYDISAAKKINTTWNIWDYHRETIRLADLRKQQTHSTQTVISYGQRNAQHQTDNRRTDV